jgi:CheY-like chemotaxis protein
MSITGKILVIDDEPALRQTLARILLQAGMEVTTAENGEQGLAFLDTSKFDLIYMDLCMPGLAGLDALDLVRSRHPGLPVILFTAARCPIYRPTRPEFCCGRLAARGHRLFVETA